MTEHNDKSNVRDFQNAAAKKQKTQKKSSTGENPASLNLSQKQRFIASWLNGEMQSWILEQKLDFSIAPEKKFMLLQMRANHKSLYYVSPENEVVPCMEDDLIRVIGKAVHSNFYDLVEPTDKIIRGAAQYWQMITPLSTPPKVITWGDDPSLALRRLPCVYGNGPTPHWDNLIENFTNSTALQAFIGSLLEDLSYMQQFIWLYGSGGDGKGTLLNFLSRLLGNNLHKAESVPQITNRFWLYGFKDARLVSFAECDDPKFIQSATFKSMVGGDRQRLESKFGQPYSGDLMCKFIFCSNEKPAINSEYSNLRRLIYCESKNLMKGKTRKIDTFYGQKLWEERGFIMSKCLDIYRQLCPNHEPIPHDQTGVLDLVHTSEEIFESFLEDLFVVGPNEKCCPNVLAARIDHRFKSKKEQLAFRKWLTDVKGVVKKTDHSVVGRSSKKYFGISPKWFDERRSE